MVIVLLLHILHYVDALCLNIIKNSISLASNLTSHELSDYRTNEQQTPMMDERYSSESNSLHILYYIVLVFIKQ